MHKDCPLSNKEKLRMVLKGKAGTCPGCFEKDEDLGIFLLKPPCQDCSFRDKTLEAPHPEYPIYPTQQLPMPPIPDPWPNVPWNPEPTTGSPWPQWGESTTTDDSQRWREPNTTEAPWGYYQPWKYNK